MKILLINTKLTGGGAEISTRRLYKGFSTRGHETKILNGEVNSGTDIVALDGGLSDDLRRKIHSEGWSDLFLPGADDLLNHSLIEWADIIHVQNIHGNYFPYSKMPDLASYRPVVWTWRDFWPITGGCGFPMEDGCSRYLIGCGRCRKIGTYPLGDRDTTAYHWRRKRAMLTSFNGRVVFPSAFSRDVAAGAGVKFAFPPIVVHNGVETEVFYPFSRERARARLNLPNRPTVAVLGVPYSTKNTQGAVEILNRLEPSPLAVFFGCQKDHWGQAYRGESICLGPLAHTELNTLFNAADVFLYTSLGETFGNVVAESMCAGTPVVCYKSSAMPEVAGPHSSVVDLGSVADAAAAVGSYLRGGVDRDRIRGWAVSRYSLDLCIDRYLEVFEKTLHGNIPRGKRSGATVADRSTTRKEVYAR